MSSDLVRIDGSEWAGHLAIEQLLLAGGRADGAPAQQLHPLGRHLAPLLPGVDRVLHLLPNLSTWAVKQTCFFIGGGGGGMVVYPRSGSRNRYFGPDPAPASILAS